MFCHTQKHVVCWLAEGRDFGVLNVGWVWGFYTLATRRGRQRGEGLYGAVERYRDGAYAMSGSEYHACTDRSSWLCLVRDEYI